MKLKVLLMSAMIFGWAGFTGSAYAQDASAAKTSPISKVTKADFSAAISAFEKAGVNQTNFAELNNMMTQLLSNGKQAYSRAQEAGNDEATVKVFNEFRHQEAIYSGIRKALFESEPIDAKVVISQLDAFAETL